MKQKLIYIVLVLASMHLPSSSKECGKLVVVCNTDKEIIKTEEPAAEAEDVVSFPASPLTRSFINL